MENIEIEKEILAEKKNISHLRGFFWTLTAVITVILACSYYTATKHVGRQQVDSSVFDTRLQNVENAIPVYDKRLAKLEEDMGKIKIQLAVASPYSVVGQSCCPTGGSDTGSFGSHRHA